MKNSLKTVFVAAILVAGSPAFAGTGTYTTKTSSTVRTGTPERGGSMQTGTSTVTMSDGSTSAQTWTCIGVTQPPNAKIFDAHSSCDVKSPQGDYTVSFGCQILEGGRQGCIGGLYGRTGSYAGKTGAVTFAGTMDGGSGTMQWSD